MTSCPIVFECLFTPYRCVNKVHFINAIERLYAVFLVRVTLSYVNSICRTKFLVSELCLFVVIIYHKSCPRDLIFWFAFIFSCWRRVFSCCNSHGWCDTHRNHGGTHVSHFNFNFSIFLISFQCLFWSVVFQAFLPLQFFLLLSLYLLKPMCRCQMCTCTCQFEYNSISILRYLQILCVHVMNIDLLVSDTFVSLLLPSSFPPFFLPSLLPSISLEHWPTCQYLTIIIFHLIRGIVGKTSSTLKADIEYFVKFLTAFALIQAALVFIVGVTRGISPEQGVHPSIYPAVNLSIYLAVYLSICLSNRYSVYVFYLFVQIIQSHVHRIQIPSHWSFLSTYLWTSSHLLQFTN